MTSGRNCRRSDDRAIIDTVIDSITIRPASTRQAFDPDRVTVNWTA